MVVTDWCKNNPVYGYSIAGGIFLIAIIIAGISLMSSGGGEPETTSRFYYYDMQTGELFVDEANLIPPIKAPSGGEGVIAEVYSCGDCEGEKFVGLLRKYSDAAKEAMEKELPPDTKGILVRLAGAHSRWVPEDSKAGQEMRASSVAAARSRCPGGEPAICFPPQD
ncbi:MAG: hypothetical protein AAGB26_18305 [Planctomycetota bacterium]